MHSLLPALGADLRLAECWSCPDRTALAVPITAVAGTEDPVAPEAAMQHWGGFTTADFDLRVLAGGHFFIHSDEARFVSSLPQGPERSIAVDIQGRRATLGGRSPMSGDGRAVRET